MAWRTRPPPSFSETVESLVTSSMRTAKGNTSHADDGQCASELAVGPRAKAGGFSRRTGDGSLDTGMVDG
jgi:hypothetical protein